ATPTLGSPELTTGLLRGGPRRLDPPYTEQVIHRRILLPCAHHQGRTKRGVERHPHGIGAGMPDHTRNLSPKPASASRMSLAVITHPGQANAFGTLHGGVILRLADECGAIVALR